MIEIMPAIMRQIVFTKKEIEEEFGVSRNTVSTLIDKLVELDILISDSNYAKLSYRYNKIYNVFVGKYNINIDVYILICYICVKIVYYYNTRTIEKLVKLIDFNI